MNRNIPRGMVNKSRHAPVLLVIAAVGSIGCRGTYEAATKDDLATAGSIVAQEDAPPKEPELDGTLSSYVAHALARSPELRASFERWKAATMRISRARRMPEPVINYG